MIPITNLLKQAQALGIKIYPQDGKAQVEMQWPGEKPPDSALVILGELKTELLAHFALAGRGNQFHIAQQSCYEARHCLKLTTDCDWFPVYLKGTWFCRERIKNT